MDWRLLYKKPKLEEPQYKYSDGGFPVGLQLSHGLENLQPNYSKLKELSYKNYMGVLQRVATLQLGCRAGGVPSSANVTEGSGKNAPAEAFRYKYSRTGMLASINKPSWVGA